MRFISLDQQVRACTLEPLSKVGDIRYPKSVKSRPAKAMDEIKSNYCLDHLIFKLLRSQGASLASVIA